jgi:Zinc finger, C3HC4 type (RING finger)
MTTKRPRHSGEDDDEEGSLIENHDSRDVSQAELHQKIKQLTEELASAQSGAEALQSRLQSREGVISRWRQRYDVDTKSLQTEVDWLREELRTHRDTIDDLEMARASLEINNDELFRIIHDKSLQISRLQAAFVAREESSSSSSSSSDSDEDDRREVKITCVCCKTAAIDTCFSACRHAAACETCVQRLLECALENQQIAKCPICRAQLAPRSTRFLFTQREEEVDMIYSRVHIVLS